MSWLCACGVIKPVIDENDISLASLWNVKRQMCLFGDEAEETFSNEGNSRKKDLPPDETSSQTFLSAYKDIRQWCFFTASPQNRSVLSSGR